MAPPPPPPSEDTTPLRPEMLVTPPQKHKTPFGYGYRRASQCGKTAQSSPATSHASSSASPSQQLLKTRSAGDVLSPRVRATRMDPYPRYSPRKRLSADYSDGTYSAESGVDSPRSEKGGWRIHAAVQGPFLTGPLAEDFSARLDEIRSPRGKKVDEPDFHHSGLLLFPVVPDFVAPAITPEVFQASIQPTPAPQAQPQPEPDHSAVAPQTDACYAAPNTDQYYPQPATTDAVTQEATWDAAAYQQQQEQYYYAQQQQYSGEQQEYYYNNGYDQQYNAAYTNDAYNYQQTYEQYPAVAAEQPSVEPAQEFNMMSPQNAEAFPPLTSHIVATPEVDTPTQITSEAVAPSNQASEPVAAAAPSSPVRRSRAPSYAEVVSGAAHTTPAATQAEAPKAPAKATFASFDQLSDGIAESMSRILAKSNGNRTHAEVEFSCLIHRIQTQLKLMGRVSNSLHLKQMKTLHKLQKSEIAKLSIESSNVDLLARVKKYELEQDELKKQLAEALEAKDVRLKDAVDQLSAKIDSLKNSTDASTSTLASEIDAIRKCSSPDDLEKRVEEIGQVLDYLIENQSESSASAKTGSAPPKRRSSKFEARRQSVGTWKAIALYAIVVWAASLCGVWVGVKYAGSANVAPVATAPEATVVEPHVLADITPVVESLPVLVEDFTPVSADPEGDEIREVVVTADLSAEPEVENVYIEREVVNDVEFVDEEVAVQTDEVAPLAEAIEETMAPEEETLMSENEPALVFTFEQIARPSQSCFSCPSDHSTMASFFCEMLSEVISEKSVVYEESSVNEPLVIETADEVVEEAVSPVVDVDDEVAVESIPVSETLNSILEDVEEDATSVEELNDEEIEVEVEVVQDEVTFSEVFETTPIHNAPRHSANMMSSQLVHALYQWCPSLFEMHTEEKDASTGPFSDLARALTSLSSQILSEHTASAVEEVIEEADQAVFEEIDEVQEPDAEGTTHTMEEVIATAPVETASVFEEIELDQEFATDETVAEVVAEEMATTVSAEEVADSEIIGDEVAEVADTEIIGDEVAEVETEIAISRSDNRWATEQLLINIGVLSGTAEVSIVDAPVTSEPVEEPVAESITPEVALEEPIEVISVEEVSPAEDVVVSNAEIVEDIAAETTEIESFIEAVFAAPSVEQAPAESSCPLERCPLFETGIIEEAKYTNTSDIIAETSFQIAEESAIVDEEISEPVGTSPAVDFKSLLLTSL